MSRYGNSTIEYLYDEIRNNLEEKNITMWDLYELFYDIQRARENQLENKIRVEMEQKYSGYKKKYEQMQKIME